MSQAAQVRGIKRASIILVVLATIGVTLVGNVEKASAGPFLNAWTGATTSVTGALTTGTASVTSDGTTTPAQFDYGYVNPATAGITGSWTFSTTAAASGTIPLSYTYSGFHAFFHVTADLNVFVKQGLTPIISSNTVLVHAGPTDCCTPPSGAFCYQGSASVIVAAGDTYGFAIAGSNFDSNSTLRGTLVVNTGTTPAPCPPPPTTTTTSTTTTTTVPPAPIGVSANIVQAVESVSGTIINAQLGGAPGNTYTVNVLAAAACANGQLTAPGPKVGSFHVSTNAQGDGYGGASVASALPFFALSVSLNGSLPTPASQCIPRGADNDTWTRALNVPLSGAGPVTGGATGYVDAPGGARWYKFAVQPGSKVHVDLSNLPADYDLALFRDISQTFNTLTTTADLTKLSAEFSPSVFSPSVFSPSVFSPSVFSPDAYSPSVFSPSVFSPSVFSPSVFSPSVFSPSVFSPSVFSPSVFSPSVFSPSVFSPSVFSPSVFSPSVFSPSVFSPDTFASAQTRSLIATSNVAGTANESIVADTWNNTGYFYVRVSGRNGASSTASPFSLSVTRDDLPACAGVGPMATGPTGTTVDRLTTIVLMDKSRMPVAQTGNGDADFTVFETSLSMFLGRVNGIRVDVGTLVSALNAQADAHKGCPYAKNLVASAIKDVVSAYRAVNPGLKYVVLIGSDNAIPFFRYPDESLLGPESDYTPPVGSDTSSQASLRLNYVLGQDEYGSKTSLSLGVSPFPLPDLAVGRLVETAREASGMLDAYNSLNNGTVPTPTSALVTGYDFLADAANAVSADFGTGMGTPVDQLITAGGVSPQQRRDPNSPTTPYSWTADELRAKLFGSRHDLVFLAGHFSANNALAADFSSTVLSTELANTRTDFVNSVIFSAGCHSGYNIVDGDGVPGVTEPLDWAQAAARKQATLIAGTGYQYGDTDFLEYSERIYSGFTKQLLAGSGPVAVGDALMRSKQAYLAATPDPRGIHRKALLESALFGLPMLSVDLPHRVPLTTDAPAVTEEPVPAGTPGSTLGLTVANTTILDATTRNTVPLVGIGTGPVTATYYSGTAGVVTNPAEPAIPLVSKNVTVAGKVLRGVGFRGGAYSDQTVVPLTGAATTELRGVHTPFVSPVFFPMRLATVNYFDALSGGSTRLLVTPAQHRALPGSATESTLRLYQDVKLKLFYSANISNPALSAAPSISGVNANVEGQDIVFRASVTGNPAAGVQQVWVTYTEDGPSRWQSLDLDQCFVTPAHALPAGCGVAESTRWVGRITNGAGFATNLRFMAQAVNGVGLVTLDDALGAYYTVAGPASVTPIVQAATTLVLTAPPAAVFGSTASVSAMVSAGGTPVGNVPVTFTLGSTTVSSTTFPNGTATATLPVTGLPGPTSVRASFAGTNTFLASSASAAFTVAKSPTNLTITTGLVGPGVKVTLKDGRGGPLQRTVYLIVSGSQQKVIALTTNFLGEATLSPLPLGPGTYSLQAQFLGEVPGLGTLSDPTYIPSVASGGSIRILSWSGFFQPVDNLPAVNSAKAGSAVPVKFSLAGNQGLNIFAPNYPLSVPIACASGGVESDIDQTSTTSTSGLSYDLTSDQYSYLWKTDKTWAGTCRQLQILLVDGTPHVANFKFK